MSDEFTINQDELDNLFGAAAAAPKSTVDPFLQMETATMAAPPPPPPPPPPPKPQVNANAASFNILSNTINNKDVSDISLIKDIPLELTVELGRTRRHVKDVLDLGPGSVVELDRLVGEPVDLLANGKMIARGEVVVVDENFGIRITQITGKTEERK